MLDDKYFELYDFNRLERKEYRPPWQPPTSVSEGIEEKFPFESNSQESSSMFYEKKSKVTAAEISRLDGEYATM